MSALSLAAATVTAAANVGVGCGLADAAREQEEMPETGNCVQLREYIPSLDQAAAAVAKAQRARARKPVGLMVMGSGRGRKVATAAILVGRWRCCRSFLCFDKLKRGPISGQGSIRQSEPYGTGHRLQSQSGRGVFGQEVVCAALTSLEQYRYR
jgi:hypothetical protein